MTIRARLVQLVLAVWLPAALALGLLTWSTHQRELANARERVEQAARNLNAVIEREIDKRAVLARTLAASRAAGERDLNRFHAEASAAVARSEDWAFLVDARWQYVNSRFALAASHPVERLPYAPLAASEPEVHFTMSGPRSGRPVIAVFTPASDARLNVGVGFSPERVQRIVERQGTPADWLVAVVNREQLIMARNRDPQRWLGVPASGPMRDRLAAGQSGFAESTTLDGVASLSYVSPPNRYGWAVVVALPQTALTAAASRLTWQATMAACALLALGLFVAVAIARRLERPVQTVRAAAATLQDRGVPDTLHTGLAETDAIARVLHRAALEAQAATRLLEERVSAAIDETRATQAQLFEAQKREALGRLTGGLAHDFNNLLQTISTGLQVIDRTVGDGPHRRVLHAAQRATARGADLVRQLLAFGRTQPLEPGAVPLADFVLRSEELTRRALGERIRLSAQIDAGLPALHVDPVQLEVALLNLIFNARDAMPSGGAVSVIGRVARADETAALAPGAYACVEVVDEGEGMSADTLAKACEPYFTTKPIGAGSGLGLAQVHAFARQSGGEVRLHSEPGRGTRVTMILPTTLALDGPAAASAAAPRSLRPLRVLMVEDDVLVASVVAPALEAAGHSVTVCQTADEAREHLARGETAHDVLFTDVVMPGRMTGLELAAWTALHRPGTRCVIASGYTAQPLAPDVRVLRKPYALDALMAALDEAAGSAA